MKTSFLKAKFFLLSPNLSCPLALGSRQLFEMEDMTKLPRNLFVKSFHDFPIMALWWLHDSSRIMAICMCHYQTEPRRKWRALALWTTVLKLPVPESQLCSLESKQIKVLPEKVSYQVREILCHPFSWAQSNEGCLKSFVQTSKTLRSRQRERKRSIKMRGLHLAF